VLVSRSFELLSGQASTDIDLGSDHRAVKSILKGWKLRRKYKKSQPTLKNWTPLVGPSGRAENFEAAVQEELGKSGCMTTENLGSALYEAGVVPGVQVKATGKCKHWQSGGMTQSVSFVISILIVVGMMFQWDYSPPG